ncbi:MAG: hypothetical protein AAF787_11560 [Chloroflexota bacterium]
MTDPYKHMMEHNYRRQQFEAAVERDRLIARRPRIRINLKQRIVTLVSAIRLPRVHIKRATRHNHKAANSPS